MGLGRLNPGCGCACSDPPPSDLCELAGYRLRLIGYTFSSTAVSMSGGIFHNQASRQLSCDNAPWVSEQNTSYVVWPHFTQRVCNDFKGHRYGITTLSPIHSSVYETAVWPFSSIGGCTFGVSNFDANRPVSVQSAAGTFEAIVGYGLMPGHVFPWVSVTLIHRIRIAEATGCNSQSIDAPMFTGVAASGANYTATGTQSNRFFTEVTTPGEIRSSYSRVDLDYQFNGQSFYTADCLGIGFMDRIGWFTRTLESSSSWFFYINDPIFGGQREFSLWQPGPFIDPWGLLNSDATVELDFGD